MKISLYIGLAFFGLAGSVLAGDRPVFTTDRGRAETPPQKRLVDRKQQLGYLVVSPQGPTDGGDFGPHTAGTKTSGLQQAFDRAKETTQNVFVVGGNLTAGQNQGVVYFLWR